MPTAHKKPSHVLQVKEGRKWKTVRTGDDGEYLKLIGDRHWSRYEKRRVMKTS